ncbi:MAG: CPBP family intramembrane metalloprotease [SAR324 cluster bacterium]|nr:CPBP family intramembrane metalloprotease [SAR324 cluster bacterium]
MSLACHGLGAWVWPRKQSAAVLATLLLLCAGQARAVPPEIAATASLLLPGGGQAINGDFPEGGLQFVTAVVLVTNYTRLIEDDRYIPIEDRTDEQNKEIDTNRVTFEADLYGTALLSLALYSSFGAYRDARQARNNAGYSTPAPTESLGELAAAPFTPAYLFRLTTWVPLIFPFLFAVTDADDDRFLFRPDNTISRDEMRVGYFGVHEMVAVGEESFFRGFLNNGFSSTLGRGYGLALSSTLFGLAHEGDGAQATPLGAALFGLYVGYLQQENDYRIGQGVAIHFWWNYLVTLGMLKDREPNQIVQIYATSYRF